MHLGLLLVYIYIKGRIYIIPLSVEEITPATANNTVPAISTQTIRSATCPAHIHHVAFCQSTFEEPYEKRKTP